MPRPDPQRGTVEIAAAWIAWIGTARLVLTVVAVVAVCGGGWWLLRAPSPPAEARLPVAAASSSPPSATLPPPPDRAESEPVGSGPAADGASSIVIVHVAGAVARPGVYEVPPGARVAAAIDAAGGASPTAEVDGLNLAAPVADGERIYVPEVGEIDPASVATGPPRTVDTGTASSSPPDGPIDLNEASADQLDALPGVGPATAAAIVDDRQRNGPFATVDDLDRVPGIGPAKLAALRDLVTV